MKIYKFVTYLEKIFSSKPNLSYVWQFETKKSDVLLITVNNTIRFFLRECPSTKNIQLNTTDDEWVDVDNEGEIIFKWIFS